VQGSRGEKAEGSGKDISDCELCLPVLWQTGTADRDCGLSEDKGTGPWTNSIADCRLRIGKDRRRNAEWSGAHELIAGTVLKPEEDPKAILDGLPGAP